MNISTLKSAELKNQKFVKFRNTDSRAVDKDLSSDELMETIFASIKRFFKLYR